MIEGQAKHIPAIHRVTALADFSNETLGLVLAPAGFAVAQTLTDSD
jgi:hypothetical protein